MTTLKVQEGLSILADPEKELQAMCEKIGMDYDPKMVNYGEKSLDTRPR